MGEYLHKDFHGALSCGFQYVKERYGQEGLEEYWQRLARNCYPHLSASLKHRGLPALEEHYRQIFELEGGAYKLFYQGEMLVLEVGKCPAIVHMHKRGYPVAEDFCRHCDYINREVCRRAGFGASCTARQEAGECRQQFWPLES